MARNCGRIFQNKLVYFQAPGSRPSQATRRHSWIEAEGLPRNRSRHRRLKLRAHGHSGDFHITRAQARSRSWKIDKRAVHPRGKPAVGARPGILLASWQECISAPQRLPAKIGGALVKPAHCQHAFWTPAAKGAACADCSTNSKTPPENRDPSSAGQAYNAGQGHNLHSRYGTDRMLIDVFG